MGLSNYHFPCWKENQLPMRLWEQKKRASRLGTWTEKMTRKGQDINSASFEIPSLIPKNTSNFKWMANLKLKMKTHVQRPVLIDFYLQCQGSLVISTRYSLLDCFCKDRSILCGWQRVDCCPRSTSNCR